jgi:hypothetical protein
MHFHEILIHHEAVSGLLTLQSAVRRAFAGEGNLMAANDMTSP